MKLEFVYKSRRSNRFLIKNYYLYGWILAELVGAGEAGGSGSDDDNVGVGVRDHVRHVPPRHLARHDRLLDRLELERSEIVRRRRRSRHRDREVL